jgi:cyclopropane-fatty-acyl-phospholipid synthase
MGRLRRAAATYGCRVTTTTISRASSSTPPPGSPRPDWRRVEVRHDDYRDLTGTYDKVVSIEMIEAVDCASSTFFEVCQRLLAPDGVMGLQAIVIPAHRYERAKNTEDFIKAFNFPGGCLPSIEAITRVSGRTTVLTLTDVDDFGLHYAETLRRWKANLDAHADELPALGLDDGFRRMWDFYLAYCEAAFDERRSRSCSACSRPGARVASVAGCSSQAGRQAGRPAG